MKIAVLIPTRGDRKPLLENCLRLINKQSLRQDHIEIVDDPPTTNDTDITKRYRTGYDRLRNNGFDVILFMEDDDWYSHLYIETMVNRWVTEGKPDLLGTSYTIYYHIGLFAHYKMEHYQRSSAMSTLIKPDLNFNWCPDSEPYTDMWLWMRTGLKGKIFTPENDICLGIKGHKTGRTGGFSHQDRLHRYTVKDEDRKFLRSIVDPESFEFYSNYLKKELV